MEDPVQSLDQEDTLEKEMATHSLPGESHGQRSLAGNRPGSHKESDMTDHTHTHNTPQLVRLEAILLSFILQ